MDQYIWGAEIRISANSEEEANEIRKGLADLEVAGAVRDGIEIVIAEEGTYMIVDTDES